MKKIIFLTVFFLMLLGAIFGIIDYGRVKNNEMPLFTIKVPHSYSQQKINYIGLGYRLQRSIGVSPKEPLSHNLHVKFGLWLYTWKIDYNLN